MKGYKINPNKEQLKKAGIAHAKSKRQKKTNALAMIL